MAWFTRSSKPHEPEEEYVTLSITVPNHRKISGHVHYKIITARGSDGQVVGTCEKRHSQIKAWKENIEKFLGSKVYNEAFRDGYFPNYGGMMGTTSKLGRWFDCLIILFNKGSFIKSSKTKNQFRSMVMQELNINKTEVQVHPPTPISSIDISTQAKLDAGAAESAKSADGTKIIENDTATHVLPVEVTSEITPDLYAHPVITPILPATPSTPPIKVTTPKEVTVPIDVQRRLDIEAKAKQEKIKMSKTINRLITKTSATHIPYAVMRFTAYGRFQYALHAGLYLTTALANSDMGEGEAGKEDDVFVALLCLMLGAVNLHACFSEERSPFFFQCMSVVALWVNLVISFGNVESLLLGIAPPLPLKFFGVEQSLESDFLMLLLNIITVIVFYNMDTTLIGLKKAIMDFEHLSNTFVVSFLHGIFVAFPILVANLDRHGISSTSSSLGEVRMIFRHVLFVTGVLNITASSPIMINLSLMSMHILHTLPFLTGIFNTDMLQWPFSVPVSCFLFIVSVAICRHPSLVEGTPEDAPVPVVSWIHDRLCSGSVFGRMSSFINALLFLFTLLAIPDESRSQISFSIQCSIFLLGWSNVHVVLSSKYSHWSMSAFSFIALIGNSAMWLHHLQFMFLNNADVSPMSFACSILALPTFETYLVMSQLGIMSIIILFSEMNIKTHDVPVTVLNCFQGVLVILPVLRSRMIELSNDERHVGFDSVLFAAYLFATSGVFHKLADDIFAYISSSLYCLIVLSFYKVSVPGVGILMVPQKWYLNLRESLVLALVSLFVLRFKYLLKPQVKAASR